VVTNSAPAAFGQRNNATLEGERAARAAMPTIRARLAQLRQKRQAELARRTAPPPAPKCQEPGFFGELLGREPKCETAM